MYRRKLLEDGVYLSDDGNQLWLSNNKKGTNAVCLQPYTLRAMTDRIIEEYPELADMMLKRFVKKAEKDYLEQKEKDNG